MHTQKNKIFIGIVLLILLALIIAGSRSITNRSRINLVEATSPVLKFLRSSSSFFRKIMPFANFREENRLLRNKVIFLTRKLEESKMISDENDRLKEILNFRKSVPYTTIPAQVIGRDPTNWSNSVIIDKGLTHGVRPNKAVVSVYGLVGRVLEVGKNSSKILLITDPNSKVGVLITKNRHGGILVGRPDGKCKMIYIALDSDVAPGDKVITAGFGTVFPKDILVGEVSIVGKEPGRLYKYAIVKPAQELSKLEEVLCIK